MTPRANLPNSKNDLPDDREEKRERRAKRIAKALIRGWGADHAALCEWLADQPIQLPGKD